MRNIIGSPAEGDDFFDRPGILKRLLRELDDHANILLVAPRRVGKTSLAIRLCERWKANPHRVAVFLNVEGRGDELAFAEKLIEELVAAKLHPDLLTRAKGAFTKFRESLDGAAIKALGFEASLGKAGDADDSTLGKVLESVFRKMDQGDDIVLIAIDELPEFLLTLQKAEDGPNRVAAFLHRLRELRQSYRKQIRWLFLGSIGLDSFVEDQRLQRTINDLQVASLDAFSAAEADAFLKQLGESNGLALTVAERAEIVRQLGWPLAYHLQLVFHEFRDTESRSVDQAVRSLLQPQKLAYFETWSQRIDDQFSVADATACKAILTHLCRHANGRRRVEILNVLMAAPSAEVDKVEDRLSRILLVLQRDGYLLESTGRYAFRSFLLREYWHRKFVK